ncbi:hypothetical protein [Streptomyces sp. NRRL S-350]|uniref:hypothetical protein n=1 Tax=Streptomyces sp. NRRL S-350 TaxID=1463902 RepID=UPI0007C4F7FC|nr:hypothetical protein [Streptomyces sp. NRRL S-350]
MRNNQLGRLIGASFGLVFLLRNAGAFPTLVSVPLRVLAVLAFLRVFLAIRRTPPAADDGRATAVFGKGYRLVVAAEVVAGLGGLVVLNPVLHLPEASVGWISLVVGLHFFGLAAAWGMPVVRRLAAALSACGALGMALALADAPFAVTATVAGIVPGVLLLASVARPTPAPSDRAGAPA